MEEGIVSHRGYPIHLLQVEGLRRKLSIENFRVLYHLGTSLFNARKWLKKTKPDIVIGTGGYASFPLVRMAAAMGIPTAIHESNAIPGLAVKLLAHNVDRVWLGMENAKAFLHTKKEIVLMGNPLRSAFTQTLYAKANAKQKLGIRQKEFFVVSFGGSLGAKKLNDCMYEILKAEKDKSLRFCHICGEKYKGNYDTKALPKQHLWLSYTEDMPTFIEAADVIICRAGAMTLAEIAAAKKVAILIPSPNVAKNHQFYNAKALVDKNAAFLLQEETLSAQLLKEQLEEMKSSPKRIRAIENNIARHFQLDTERIFLEEIDKLCKCGKK